MSNKKQDFLDKAPTSNEEMSIQLLLTRCTKTKVTQMLREITAINDALYKTYLREQTLAEILTILTRANELNTNKED